MTHIRMSVENVEGKKLQRGNATNNKHRMVKLTLITILFHYFVQY